MFSVAKPKLSLQLSRSSRLLRKLSSSSQVSPDAPSNEQIIDYSDAHSSHRSRLLESLDELERNVQDIPIVIGGKEFRTNLIKHQYVPFNHKHKVAQFYYATHELIHQATVNAVKTRSVWERIPLNDKLKIFERAADLVSGKWRSKLNAATIMGQAKTVKQAEIDAAAELADFLRFNVHYMRHLTRWQPKSTDFEANSIAFRGLEGFVAAISPFNFTAIGGNLASAPTLASNCVVWKPSDTAVLSNYLVFKIFQEAGLPDGVINFVPSEGLDFGRVVTSSKKLAGINFTGSLATFQWIWSEVGLNVKRYESFPRLLGECGGKNFHLIHPSAHLDTAVAQTIRSAFEYSGQKCSACSRLYVPASVWNSMKDRLLVAAKEIKLGPANDLSVFTSAVIDGNAYKRISDFIEFGKAAKDEVKLLCGGEANKDTGYFIQPTIFETKNPDNLLMKEEIFGPVLTAFVYPDADIDRVFELIDNNSYALTGSIFSKDEQFISRAIDRLRMSAGNLYINDKSTGAVVGQQPFGGARLSGTNDKAGGPHYLLRWLNPQTIKRTSKDLPDF